MTTTSTIRTGLYAANIFWARSLPIICTTSGRSVIEGIGSTRATRRPRCRSALPCTRAQMRNAEFQQGPRPTIPRVPFSSRRAARSVVAHSISALRALPSITPSYIKMSTNLTRCLNTRGYIITPASLKTATCHSAKPRKSLMLFPGTPPPTPCDCDTKEAMLQDPHPLPRSRRR